jgi:hypothetical protein
VFVYLGLISSTYLVHQSSYRHVKHFYLKPLKEHWHQAFPGLVSYQRFVAWIPSPLIPLCAYLKHGFGRCTGISFIDATSLKVCPNRRISGHRVFDGLAARGKTSVDWCLGFKRPLVVSEHSELLNLQITPGKTDDRKPVVDWLKGLFGKVFADRGYVSKALATELRETWGIECFAKPRRNLKNHLMRLNDKLLVRRCVIVETVIDQLKTISQIVALASSQPDPRLL